MKRSYLITFLMMILLVSNISYANTQKIKDDNSTRGDYPANPIIKDGWILDYNDEFNEQNLDTDHWLPYYLPHWTTKELSATDYTFRENALVLRIDEDYPAWNPTYDGDVKCSSIQSFEKDNIHQFNKSMPLDHHESIFDGYTTKYGYFEIRAKLPGGSGGHVAWWMIGCEDESYQKAEVDIVENPFSYTTNSFINIHPHDDATIKSETFRSSIGYDLANTWHVYGFEWDPSGMKFYIDNKLVGNTNQSVGYRMMTFLGIYRDCGWDGVNDGVYPKEFLIDYFRVYKREGGYTNNSLAVSATATATSEFDKFPVDRLTDTNPVTEFMSGRYPDYPHYVTFRWESPQTFNQVSLESWYCQGQAPTNWDIQVSEDGSTNWSTVASSGDIVWEKNDDTVESRELTFDEQENNKGLRIKVNDANLQWQSYVIRNIVID
ncbi:hypothetical protein SH1V18_26790 [Vallitalea longa]|uniref:Uncharacterized protein n=1 Tax=Vallitalea longa TaxID=2936439 RepID=A0A9W6DGV9_9FIRM|nr:family 16 glycosylhydrolase [Vallitalea longa]GKX30199.1 hypothetical protein SH1V18_26790 [Vallitalea longa]